MESIFVFLRQKQLYLEAFASWPILLVGLFYFSRTYIEKTQIEADLTKVY